jgi:hypothetical protein
MTEPQPHTKGRLDGWRQTMTGRRWLKAERLRGWRRAFAMAIIIVEVAVVGVIIVLLVL